MGSWRVVFLSLDPFSRICDNLLSISNSETLFSLSSFQEYKSRCIYRLLSSRLLWDFACYDLNYHYNYQYSRPNRKSASSEHTLCGPRKTDSGLLMHYQSYS